MPSGIYTRTKKVRFTEEHKRKISNAKLGHVVTVETRKKISSAVTGKYVGDKSPHWKNRPGYRGIHQWINKVLGKATKCSRNALHKSTRYHWANISGKYLRDVSDWEQLCPSCNIGGDAAKKKGNQNYAQI